MSFQQYLKEYETLSLSRGLPDHYCPAARDFQTWIDELLGTLGATPAETTITEAKAMLLDRYFAWRQIVSSSHRDHLGKRGHHCLFTVFEHGYDALTRNKLLAPPRLTSTEASPVVPIAGVFLGETPA